ncbi:MAG: hypothetical protein AAFQ94_09320 [Bacteroidota bacterium]
MKPLNIPKKDRIKGTYIVCSKCNTNVSDKCKLTGKSLSSCKHGENHRFQSKIYDPARGRMIPLKSWPADKRDYNEIKKLHIDLIDNHSFAAQKPKSFRYPQNLRGCQNMYLQWEDDMDEFGKKLPAHKTKNKGHKTKQGIVNAMKHFNECLKQNKIDPGFLPIHAVNDHHMGLFHEYLEDYSAATYNNFVDTMRAFYKYLGTKGYQLYNPFTDVQRKAENKRKDIITKDEFDKVIAVCTPDNGWLTENKGGGRMGRKQMYKDWLVEGWIYSLLSGDRPEEVAERKLSDLLVFYIENTNHKVNRVTKSTSHKRVIPLSWELKQFIEDQRKKYRLLDDSYLIAPNESNRKLVQNHLGKAFTHYMKQVDPDSKVTRYCLRNTYATAMTDKFGEEFTKMIGLHSRPATTYNHYINQLKIAQNMEGYDFWE